jgi:hypothetical protein
MLITNQVHILQVRGEWAGDVTPGWRPAVAGTLNQTGQSDEQASTFSSIEEAEATLGVVKAEVGIPKEPAAGVPEFRIAHRVQYEVTPDSFSHAALEAIEETGLDVAADVERLIEHRVTPAELLAECLQGADDDRVQGWRDYVRALELLVPG